MNYNRIIEELARNADVFKELFSGLTEEGYLWKQAPEKWCLLEIICHLYDEEREDFRQRTKLVLEDPEQQLPPIDPVGWVQERNYINQNYTDMQDKFLNERRQSVDWLNSLENPQWKNAYNHPKLGKMTAKLFLSNWLAHDYLHIRQIIRLKFDYLKHQSGEDLNYAGTW